MRKFIIKTMIVVVSWLLPLYILQFLYDKTAQQVYDRWPYDKINMAFDKPQNADLVIMGNSRGTGNYIQQILDFIDQFKMKPEDIRKTVEHLTWKVQMQKVLDSLF